MTKSFLDVAHGLQFVLEKGIDTFGRAAVAQSDIEKYYDNLNVLRAALAKTAHQAASAYECGDHAVTCD